MAVNTPAVGVLLSRVLHAASIADIAGVKYLVGVVGACPQHRQMASIDRVDTLATVEATTSQTSMGTITVG